jgi:hypothetical protein
MLVDEEGTCAGGTSGVVVGPRGAGAGAAVVGPRGVGDAAALVTVPLEEELKGSRCRLEGG